MAWHCVTCLQKNLQRYRVCSQGGKGSSVPVRPPGVHFTHSGIAVTCSQALKGERREKRVGAEARGGGRGVDLPVQEPAECAASRCRVQGFLAPLSDVCGIGSTRPAKAEWIPSHTRCLFCSVLRQPPGKTTTA